MIATQRVGEPTALPGAEPRHRRHVCVVTETYAPEIKDRLGQGTPRRMRQKRGRPYSRSTACRALNSLNLSSLKWWS